jgi:putative glutamine amidotransferase
MTLLIGVTQRVEVVSSYNERRDCLDQRWVNLLEALGMYCIPLANRTNSVSDYLDALKPSGLILSGGNNLGVLGEVTGVADERDSFEHELLMWAEANKISVLGVCRGAQMINHFCGGSLVSVNGHMSTNHALKQNPEHSEWPILPKVNSYHNYAIETDGLAPGLIPLAFSDDGTIEAFRHKKLPWYGIMWHPERERTFHVDDLMYIKKVFGK